MDRVLFILSLSLHSEGLKYMNEFLSIFKIYSLKVHMLNVNC